MRRKTESGKKRFPWWIVVVVVVLMALGAGGGKGNVSAKASPELPHETVSPDEPFVSKAVDLEPTPDEIPETRSIPTPEPEPEATPEPTPEPEATAASDPTPAPTPAPQTFVLNTSSKKYHDPSCASVADIKDKNKSVFEGTREEVEAMGYQACKRCGG